jgi:hypothetical protein
MVSMVGNEESGDLVFVLERGRRGTVYIGVEIVVRRRHPSLIPIGFYPQSMISCLDLKNGANPCLLRSKPSLGGVWV